MNKLRKISCVVFSFCISTTFAGKVKQALIIDPEHGSQVVTYKEEGDYAITEGDIIIATLEELKRQGALVQKNLNTRWPDGLLPYKINSAMPAVNRTYIQQAIEHIQEKTNVRFVLLTAANQSKYKDYVEFMPSNQCSAYVGRQGGRQTISLATNCKKGNTIHEICHTLGFFHEISRSDRDSYVRIIWDNIRADAKGNFNMQLTNGFKMGGYDYDSIMHYGPKDFSKNGKDTIVPLKAGVDIGGKTALSSIDIETMNRIYKK